MADPQCPVQYERLGGRQHGDRIVHCHLERGHPGEHEEADTGVTWLTPPAESPTGMVCQTCGTDYGPDLHSDTGNASPRCNCFGPPGTNPGCPVHGNHATPPAVRHQDIPIDPGAGETTTGPGWDALRADRDRLDATLTNARAVASDRIADRDKLIRELMAERDAARADLDAALVTIRGQLVLQRTARRDGAADMLDRAAAKLQAYSDVHSSTVAMLRRWAAEVRTIPPTDRSSDA